ncbi:MAG: heavy-metal-associated domain-containing protein [Aquabacterium sp.]|uniref:heavy-metal-associated domain-containing protein n=1 Tax=Aquabacterium sp. TaxID=1872578 RepID=UPI00272725F0|nr:heavy-metal-associated domain-containing protein [Aquabacterium sp.]MDO9002575.1 heavy-metal-associated domain-containing protein [Aquabacterium sp.]
MFEFQVPSISCGHCVKAVTQAVQSVDAQAKVQVDLAQHQVTVETLQERQAIVDVLAEAGYPVV